MTPYEYEDGLPIPPESVRQASPVPHKFGKAVLEDSVEEDFHPLHWDLAREYVAGFPRYAEEGLAPVLTGSSGTGKSWTAAAIVNELLRVRMPFNPAWLACQWELMDLRQKQRFRLRDQFLAREQELRRADLLIMDDILHVPDFDFSESKSFLMGLLAYREERCLPTLITMNADVGDSWQDVIEVFNEPFVRRVRDLGDGLTVQTMVD